MRRAPVFDEAPYPLYLAGVKSPPAAIRPLRRHLQAQAVLVVTVVQLEDRTGVPELVYR
jgi:hypothetical protein